MSSLTPLLLRGNISAAEFGRAEEVVWWCAHQGETDIVYHLARDPNLNLNYNEPSTPIYAAVHQNQIDTVEHLCDLKGVDLNLGCPRNFGAGPFWLACFKGHYNIVKIMVRTPAVNIEQSNDYGVSPRDAAVYAGHHRIVQLIDDELASRLKIKKKALEKTTKTQKVITKEEEASRLLPPISSPSSSLK